MKAIAVFEILAGVIGLIFFFYFARDSAGFLLYGWIAIVSALSIAAGYFLIRGKSRGLVLSRITQLLQLPTVATPYFAYKLGLGAVLFLGAITVPSGESMTVKANAEIGFGASYNLLFTTDPESIPQNEYAINLVALVLLIVLIRRRGVKGAD